MSIRVMYADDLCISIAAGETVTVNTHTLVNLLDNLYIRGYKSVIVTADHVEANYGMIWKVTKNG